MQDGTDSKRNYVLDNSRGYQTRGRSMGPSRDIFASGANANTIGVPEENLQLVPCRWSHTGWKYVQKDPSNTAFFTSPNRVNSFGFTSAQAKNRKQVATSLTGRLQEGGVFFGESEFQTSYGRFFNPNASQDQKTWKQRFTNADFGPHKAKKEAAPKDEKLLQWAGGLHQRTDFNKRKDPLGQWTEVLFHH